MSRPHQHLKCLAIAPAVVLFLASSCSGSQNDTANLENEPASNLAEDSAAVSAWEQMYREAETDYQPVNLDLTKVDQTDPDAVAETTACAYWAHPKDETMPQLSQRLKPLVSETIAKEISGLRGDPTNKTYIVTLGTTQKIGTNRYQVTCDRQETINGEPINSRPVETTVTVTEKDGRYQVTRLIIGGIKIGDTETTTPTTNRADTKTRESTLKAETGTTSGKLVCVSETITPDELAETWPDGNPCSPVGPDATCVSIGTVLIKPEDVKGPYYCTPSYEQP